MPTTKGDEAIFLAMTHAVTFYISISNHILNIQEDINT